MHVGEAKVRFVADHLAAWIRSQPGVEPRGSPEAVAAEIARVIRVDLRQEEALDAAVNDVLLRYRREIRNEPVDVERLRQKIKKQLAKEKGMVL